MNFLLFFKKNKKKDELIFSQKATILALETFVSQQKEDLDVYEENEKIVSI